MKLSTVLIGFVIIFVIVSLWLLREMHNLNCIRTRDPISDIASQSNVLNQSRMATQRVYDVLGSLRQLPLTETTTPLQYELYLYATGAAAKVFLEDVKASRINTILLLGQPFAVSYSKRTSKDACEFYANNECSSNDSLIEIDTYLLTGNPYCGGKTVCRPELMNNMGSMQSLHVMGLYVAS